MDAVSRFVFGVSAYAGKCYFCSLVPYGAPERCGLVRYRERKEDMRRFFISGGTALAAFLLPVLLVAQSGLPFEIVEYRPAPGQFVDYTYFLEEGQSVQDLDNAQVCAYLNAQCENMPFSYLVSLGGFGGSVTVRLKESLPDGDGADFKIYGNAFYDPAYTPALTDEPGGSAEPGIVWVSRDENGNGLPDDPWYELAGSMTDDTAAVAGYTITYYVPDSINGDIPWRDSRGDTGRIARMEMHRQDSYFPLWLASDSLVLSGRLLPPNARLETKPSGAAQWVLYSYGWGYADNHPNNSNLSDMDISWAVDAEGNPAGLESIDFVRVVTAVNQQLDLGVGETSTEFAGVEPLSRPSSGREGSDAFSSLFRLWPNPCQDGFWCSVVSGDASAGLEAGLYDLSGRCVKEMKLRDCPFFVGMDGLPAGLYLLRAGSAYARILKK